MKALLTVARPPSHPFLRTLRRLLPRRRPYSTPSPPPSSQPPPPPPSSLNAQAAASRSIPGPIWIWTAPLAAYTRVHARRPRTTQFVSALVVYLVGDLTAQHLAPTPSGRDDGSPAAYDPARTARALVIGGLAAIPGYHWFVFLSRNFNYASKWGSIVLKVVINQIVFTPIFNTYFFGMQSALSGASAADIVERIKHTVPRSWINSWKLWPAVTAFSFAFIRLELRGLFAGVIAIGWQTYLSILNQRAAKQERENKADHEAQSSSRNHI